MRTLIVGTGIVGTTYGWALDRAGAHVTYLVRPGRLTPPAEEVALDVLDERPRRAAVISDRHHRRIVDTLRPDDPYDLIVAPVPAHCLPAVLDRLTPLLANATLLLFGAAWGDPLAGHTALAPDRCLVGYPDSGGTVLDDGTLWVNIGAEVHLGLPSAGSPDRLAAAADLFRRSGMRPDLQPRMDHWLLQHAACTMAFSAGLASHGALDPFLADRALVHRCVDATKELLRVCAAQGVRLADYPETVFRHWPTGLARRAVTWNLRRSPAARRYTAHAAGDASLREAAVLLDLALATADRQRVPVPLCRELSSNLDRFRGTPNAST